MPAEIISLILHHLQPFTNPSLECSRLLPPATWRSALFIGGLFPWLWDLDERVLENLYGDENVWDLEGRQVMIGRSK